MAKSFKVGDRVILQADVMAPSLRQSIGLSLGANYAGTVMKKAPGADRYHVAIDGVTAPPGWDGGFWFWGDLLKGATDG